MKTRNKIILIAVFAIIAIFMINSVIPGFLLRTQDNLSLILYTCTLGIERSGPLMLIAYDNGTHTIDENSCAWIENSYHKIPEFEMLNEMSCDELIQRHESGLPYQNDQNREFAEHRISMCDFTDDWSDAQKKVDDWK